MGRTLKLSMAAFRTRFDALTKALARGEVSRVIVTRNGRVVGEMMPPRRTRLIRRPGLPQRTNLRLP